MRKVLLVDDEIYSLKGMEVFIPWDELGCIVCGSTTDSKEAIEIAIKEKPEIIITDINMPCIDGLELLRILKDKLPKSQGIIITGYDNFKYAVSAIKLNVIDFILKPLDEEELIVAVKKAINKLEIYNNVVKADRKLLDIARGETSLKDIYNYFKKESISMMFIDINRRDDKGIQLLINKVYKTLKDINEFKYYILKPHNYRIVVVKEGDFDKNEYILNKIKADYISIGITDEFNLKDIVKCYIQGKKIIEETFYLGYGNIINKANEEFNGSEKEIRDKLQKLNVLLGSKSNLIIKTSIEELYSFLKCNRVSKDICISVTLDILFKLRGSDKEDEDKSLVIKEIGSTVDYLKDIVLKESEKYIEINKELHWIKEDSSIDKSIEIIEKNYMENLKLKDVAKELYLNESYLSRRFKSTVGIGFNEYLTKVRMDKAIEFLKMGRLVKEVSKEVGYIDYRSFSLNFKKYTGFSPREYVKEN